VSHLALGLAFTAAVGVAEFFANRYFYSELQFVYNYKWSLTMILMRGTHLRVEATTPEPIVLAFEMIFALGIWTFLRGPDWRRWQVAGVYALLIGCMVFTFSRGPWIGAIIFGLRLNTKAFTALFVFLLGSAVVMKMLGADQFAINALSTVFGSSEADLSSINYRNELLDTALALLRQSPWLGVPDYASQMQALRQGEGIIDLVNSYIAIALDTGVVGLVIYLLPYVLAFSRMLRVPGISKRQSSDGTAGWFTAIFVAMTIALLVTIFTTSMFFTMPILLILLLALPIARLAMKTETLDLPLDIEPPRGYGIDGRALIIR
jgi:O-antigen ligase